MVAPRLSSIAPQSSLAPSHAITRPFADPSQRKNPSPVGVRTASVSAPKLAVGVLTPRQERFSCSSRSVQIETMRLGSITLPAGISPYPKPVDVPVALSSSAILTRLYKPAPAVWVDDSA